MAIRIMLADDHDVVREGLKAILRSDPGIEVIAEATTGPQAVELAEKLMPDVIILDVTMPELNGVEAMRQIRQRAPETEVIALSMHGATQVVSDMFRAGASGYLVKSKSVQELPQAIHTVMSGRTYLSQEVKKLPPPELVRTAPAGEEQSESKELTAREREVLKLVVEGKSSKEIAEALFVTTKTIVWHRQGIMDKLSLRSVAELTKYAIRMGHTPS